MSSLLFCFLFFFSSRRRHTRLQGDWSSDVCSSDLADVGIQAAPVLSAHGQAHDKRLPLRFLPVDLDATLGLGREEEQIGAVRAVDRDAAPLGDVANHQVDRKSTRTPVTL